MKTGYKILISQLVPLFLGYLFGQWILLFLNTNFPNNISFPLGGLVALILGWIYGYLFFIVLLSNLWFQKGISKWNYLIPAILVFLFPIFDNNSQTIIQGVVYWLIAFMGGWILAKIVNFVANFIKK
ncbi:MAG: hypothetical protein WA051_00800 [Minisyncoccia bacterium]